MHSSDEIPQHCPGPQSEVAGKDLSCSGCPNQSLCSASSKSNETEMVKQRVQTIKRKVMILSGKGGVGKTTVTCMLARALARSGKNVSVLDIDICGPSVPRVFGVEGEQVHQSGSGWSPIFVDDNLSVMSVGFLLRSLDDAVIWRGSKKTGLIKQFLSEVDWGNLDYLIIDTPPGTSDEHLSIASLLSDSISGAVIVSSPQEISLLDVRKEVNFCKKLNIPIIGVVENMSWFICPKCSTSSSIFPNTTGGAKFMAQEMGLPFLGQIPLDSHLTRACDEGKDIHEFDSQAASAIAIDKLAKDIDETLID